MSEPLRFRHLPNEFEAARYHILDDAKPFEGEAEYITTIDANARPKISVRTLSGWAVVHNGDWVVKDCEGSFYPITDAILKQIAVELDPSTRAAFDTARV